MSKYSAVVVEGYLIVERGANTRTRDKMRLVAKQPAKSTLGQNEVVVKLRVEVPSEAFIKPEFTATVAVDKDQVMLPAEAEVKVEQAPMRVKRNI